MDLKKTSCHRILLVSILLICCSIITVAQESRKPPQNPTTTHVTGQERKPILTGVWSGTIYFFSGPDGTTSFFELEMPITEDIGQSGNLNTTLIAKIEYRGAIGKRIFNIAGKLDGNVLRFKTKGFRDESPIPERHSYVKYCNDLEFDLTFSPTNVNRKEGEAEGATLIGDVALNPSNELGCYTLGVRPANVVRVKLIRACKPSIPERNYVFPGKDQFIQEFADKEGVGGFLFPKPVFKLGEIRLQVDKSYSPSMGHRYTTISELGKSDLCPEDIMDEIKKDPNQVFPLFTAKGNQGQPLVLNNIYELNLSVFGYELQNNPVQVTKVGKFYFTFEALPNHKLVGKATHGIIKDQDGVLWLFQEGVGAPNKESFLQIIGNYAVADVLWQRMAGKTQQLMKTLETKIKRTGCSCSEQPDTSQDFSAIQDDTSQARTKLQESSVYEYNVESEGTTDFEVKPGDEVSIIATGTIRIGPFAGYSTPDGVNGYQDYSYFVDVPHASLLVKVKGYGWHLCGSECSFTATANAPLQFLVNDADSSNNSGAYNIKITIRRQAK